MPETVTMYAPSDTGGEANCGTIRYSVDPSDMSIRALPEHVDRLRSMGFSTDAPLPPSPSAKTYSFRGEVGRTYQVEGRNYRAGDDGVVSGVDVNHAPGMIASGCVPLGADDAQ